MRILLFENGIGSVFDLFSRVGFGASFFSNVGSGDALFSQRSGRVPDLSQKFRYGSRLPYSQWSDPAPGKTHSQVQPCINLMILNIDYFQVFFSVSRFTGRGEFPQNSYFNMSLCIDKHVHQRSFCVNHRGTQRTRLLIFFFAIHNKHNTGFHFRQLSVSSKLYF